MVKSITTSKPTHQGSTSNPTGEDKKTLTDNISYICSMLYKFARTLVQAYIAN